MSEINDNCVEKKSILKEVVVKIELDVPRWRWHTMEQYAQSLEDAVNEFKIFLKDHRSQDVNKIYVEREFADVCSGCESTWEPTTDEGKEICAACGKDIKMKIKEEIK